MARRLFTSESVTEGPAYADVPSVVRAAELLRLAHQLVAVEFGSDDPLTRAALHLIDCATDVVTLLPAGDLPSAHGALGSARAAVGAATYAVRHIHDRHIHDRMAAPAGDR